MTLEADAAKSDMADREYIDALQRLIVELYGCSSEHVETVRVHETFLGKLFWEGDVEVFTVVDHPRSQHCFAWAFERRRKRRRTRLFAVLANGVIRSPLDAVKFVRVVNSERLIREFSKVREDG
jgi:hypothetical protein